MVKWLSGRVYAHRVALSPSLLLHELVLSKYCRLVCIPDSEMAIYTSPYENFDEKLTSTNYGLFLRGSWIKNGETTFVSTYSVFCLLDNEEDLCFIVTSFIEFD